MARPSPGSDWLTRRYRVLPWSHTVVAHAVRPARASPRCRSTRRLGKHARTSTEYRRSRRRRDAEDYHAIAASTFDPFNWRPASRAGCVGSRLVDPPARSDRPGDGPVVAADGRRADARGPDGARDGRAPVPVRQRHRAGGTGTGGGGRRLSGGARLRRVRPFLPDDPADQQRRHLDRRVRDSCGNLPVADSGGRAGRHRLHLRPGRPRWRRAAAECRRWRCRCVLLPRHPYQRRRRAGGPRAVLGERRWRRRGAPAGGRPVHRAHHLSGRAGECAGLCRR